MDEKVLQYKLNRMSEQEKHEFEEFIEANPSLKDHVKFYDDVDRSILDSEKAELRDKINSIIKENTYKKPGVPKLVLSRSVLVAASLTFVLALGCVLYMVSQKTYSNNELYSVYYKAYEPHMVSRSLETGDNIHPGLAAYLKKDYTGAVHIFEREENMADGLGLFYLPLSYMEIGDHEKSLNYLEEIVNEEVYPYFYHAQWYLALAYLKLNDIENGQKTLQDITENNRLYEETAADLLNKLQTN